MKAVAEENCISTKSFELPELAFLAGNHNCRHRVVSVIGNDKAGREREEKNREMFFFLLLLLLFFHFAFFVQKFQWSLPRQSAETIIPRLTSDEKENMK